MRTPNSALLFSPFVALAVGCSTPPASGLDAGADAATALDAAIVDAWLPPVPTTTIAAANAVDSNDPLWEGQQRFLYDTWGVEVLGEWPPAEFMIALMTSEPSVFGNQYASFGFLPDPDREFPIGFARGMDDPSLIHETCGLCHTGRLPDGRVWLGLANQQLDIGAFQLAVNERWVAAGHSPLSSPESRARARAPGPGRFDTAGSDALEPIPADLPSLLDFGGRTYTAYGGTGGNARSEIFLSTFAFGAGAPNAAAAVVPFPPDARIDPMVAFISSLHPPAAPPGDGAAITRGRAVFAEQHCDGCHHPDDVSMDAVTTLDHAATGALDRMPAADPMFPRGTVRTDPALFGLQDVSGGSTAAGDVADFVRFISAHRLSVHMSDGYRAGYLHALWATAPYLHNGSVETLDDLFRPASMRPSTFARGSFSMDTSLVGNGNEGHEFGTTLSDADRAALVAYLLNL